MTKEEEEKASFVRVRVIFKRKFAAKYPDHPWVKKWLREFFKEEKKDDQND